MKTLKISIGFFGLFISSILFTSNVQAVRACDALEVYFDCIDTAEQEYQAGNYSWELYQAFVYDYCVSSANSCDQQ